MTVKLYAMTCGHLTGPLGRLMEGGEGEVRLPIPAYLIEHPKGTAVFDTGMHPDCQRDPLARVGERLNAIFRFHYAPGEEISARLQVMGRDPARIDLVVNSHLHFDHVGGNALIPNATIVVQLDGEYDLFGDGSVVCLPTHGHTPGHQSLRVRLPSGDVVLAADACYFCQTLQERRLPMNVHDRSQMLASLEKLAQLQASGARIFFGHDHAFWHNVPQAPLQVT